MTGRDNLSEVRPPVPASPGGRTRRDQASPPPSDSGPSSGEGGPPVSTVARIGTCDCCGSELEPVTRSQFLCECGCGRVIEPRLFRDLQAFVRQLARREADAIPLRNTLDGMLADYGRRASSRFHSDRCKAYAHRRRRDPLVGSEHRRAIQRDALLVQREVEAVSSDLTRGLNPLIWTEPTPRDVEDEERSEGEILPPPSRRPNYFGPEAPHDGFNPVYNAIEEADELFNGLEVQESVDVDPYHEWLKDGKPRPLAVNGIYPPERPKAEVRKVRLKTAIVQLKLEDELRRHMYEVPEGGSGVIKNVVDSKTATLARKDLLSVTEPFKGRDMTTAEREQIIDRIDQLEEKLDTWGWGIIDFIAARDERGSVEEEDRAA